MTEKKIKKNNGKKFEEDFMKSGEDQGYLVERFIDNGKFGFGSVTRFSSHNPADCFIYDDNNNQVIYCELKSTEGKSFSIETDWLCNKRSIHYHQINSLLERSKHDKVHGIFVLSFIDSGKTYWISAENLLLFTVKTGKVSINENDLDGECVPIYNEPIRKTNKRSYDIINFCNEVCRTDNHESLSILCQTIMEDNNEAQKIFKDKQRKEKKEQRRLAKTVSENEPT